MRKLLGAVVVLLALSACGGPSQNATACKLYEDGYNQLQDAVHAASDGSGTKDEARAQRDMLLSRIQGAEAKAQGDVAVEMRSNREMIPGLVAGDKDAGTAFFMSATSVQKACEADGAKIALH